MKLRRTLVWTAIGAVLIGVFAAYLRPELVLTLATQLWNCF